MKSTSWLLHLIQKLAARTTRKAIPRDLRCPFGVAEIVSKASEDFPDPLNPVMTTS